MASSAPCGPHQTKYVGAGAAAVGTETKVVAVEDVAGAALERLEVVAAACQAAELGGGWAGTIGLGDASGGSKIRFSTFFLTSDS